MDCRVALLRQGYAGLLAMTEGKWRWERQLSVSNIQIGEGFGLCLGDERVDDFA